MGVLASDPEHYGGGVTADAAEKTARFVDMCDQFHLPVVNFVDVPGFVIGTEAERAGTIRRGQHSRRGYPGEAPIVARSAVSLIAGSAWERARVNGFSDQSRIAPGLGTYWKRRTVDTHDGH